MTSCSLNNILSIIAETISGNVAILKPDGDIFCVNQSWIDFAHRNGMNSGNSWQAYNYYNICRKAEEEGDGLSKNVLQGLKNLLDRIVVQIHFEYPCHSLRGKQWFELRAKLMVINNRTFICIIHNDITKRIKAETKLHESQKMFRMISENAPYGVVLIQGGMAHYANAKLLKCLEYSVLQDFISKPLLDMVHPDDRHIIGEKLRLIQEKKALYPFNTKARFNTTKGKTRFFSLDVHEIEMDNKSYSLVHVIDETDKLALERSEKQFVIDALYLNRKQEMLESFTHYIERVKDKYEFTHSDLSHFTQIKQHFKFQTNDWNLMKTHFRFIHKDFFETLSERFPLLTQHDLNFCAMLKLNFSTKEIARYLNIKVTSVKRRKVRLKKKLNLSEKDKLVLFIQSI